MSTAQRLVANVKTRVAGLLSGTSLNQTTDLNGALETAFRSMLTKISIPEAGTSQVVTLYDGVYDYAMPIGMFGGALRDFRQLGDTRNPWDFPYKRFIVDFDRTKRWQGGGVSVAFEVSNGVQMMRVAQSWATPRVVLDPMTSVGSWIGTTISLITDNSFWYSGNGSIRFNLTASGGSMAETLTSPLNLTQYTGLGVVFLAIQMPTSATAANLTSITARLGSDVSNYWSVTSTQGLLGSWTAGDWILVPFDLSTATTTGSPNAAAIKYIDLIYAASGPINNMRVGSLWISLPFPGKVIYETSAIFQPQGGTTINNFITNDNDSVLLSDPAYNIYLYECAIEVGRQNGGNMGEGVLANLSLALNGARNPRTGAIVSLGLYDNFKANNPSEQVREAGSYYDDGGGPGYGQMY